MPGSPDIALISPYPELGTRHGGHSGVASYSSNLAHALAGEGAAVAVVAPAITGEGRSGNDGPIRVHRSFRPGPLALPAAVRAAAASRARAIHLQHEIFLYGGAASIPALVPALAAARRAGGGAVVTMHHVVAPAEVDREFMRLHQVGAPVAATRAGLAAVNGSIRRLARDVIVHEPELAARIGGATVIPHGIERPSTPGRDEARRRLGLAERGFLALSFGFLAPYKGLEPTLKAAALAGPEVELVVAGGEHPRLAENPHGRALRSRLPDAARFVGRVPEADVAAWFAAADVATFMYPRPFAASGALALALAHGTPPLLSAELGAAIDAPAELVADRHPVALARRLRSLAAEPRRLDAMRKAAARLAHGRSWPEVARRHLELYDGRPPAIDAPEEVSTDGLGTADRLARAA